MKKLIVLFLLALVCIGSVCAADEYKDMEKAPALDEEGVYIIDLKPMRKLIKDNIAFVNLTEQKDISFDVYYVDYNTGEWAKNRLKAFVKGYNDRDILDLDKNIKIKKVPFIAIVPKPAGNFKYKAYPQSHDVYIDILE